MHCHGNIHSTKNITIVTDHTHNPPQEMISQVYSVEYEEPEPGTPG